MTSLAYEYTWEGTTMSGVGWARRLGIAPESFRGRLYRYGRNDPRTFQDGRIDRYSSRKPYSSFAPLTQAELLRRRRCFRELVKEHPWIVSGEMVDGDGSIVDVSEEQAEAVSLIIETMAPMAYTEIGCFLGVSRERARQICETALKRCRLKGGKELRESYEYRTQNQRITAWDDLFSGALE